jgi:hypothetical protein
MTSAVLGECVGRMGYRAGVGREWAWGFFVIVCLIAGLCPVAGWAQGSEAGAQNSAQGTSQNAPQNPVPNAAENPGKAQAPDSGQTSGKELPDAPGESKKEESANPVQQVAGLTKQVGTMTGHAATSGLIMARNWESTWITGVYIARDQPVLSLTGAQRREIYLRQTLTTPGAYMKRAFGALIDQASGTPRQWDDGWAGYGERFASREGQFITANTLAALGNAKLGYEVRYDKCKCDGLWPRTRHAIMRNLVTYDGSERNWRPQLALYGGAFGGGAVSVLWKAGSPNPWAEGGRAMAGQLGWGTLLNFVTEFSREINAKQGVR